MFLVEQDRDQPLFCSVYQVIYSPLPWPSAWASPYWGLFAMGLALALSLWDTHYSNLGKYLRLGGWLYIQPISSTSRDFGWDVDQRETNSNGPSNLSIPQGATFQPTQHRFLATEIKYIQIWGGRRGGLLTADGLGNKVNRSWRGTQRPAYRPQGVIWERLEPRMFPSRPWNFYSILQLCRTPALFIIHGAWERTPVSE